MHPGRRFLGLVLGALVCAAAPAGFAATIVPDSTLAPELFAFPGAVLAPPTAVSAGLGLADLWLGDEPFGNPAVFLPRAVVLAPTFLRVSRQDLRAHTSAYEENRGFFDAAGARVSWPVRSVGLALYAWQPVLRREDQAFTGTFRGRAGSFVTSSTSREWRAGLALSAPWRRARIGVAGEWTQRDDSYEYSDATGSPGQGLHHEDFSGGAFGFRAGVHVALHPRVDLGAALGYRPALDLSGESRYVPTNPLVRSDTSSFALHAGSGWEGGLGARIAVTPTFRVLGSIGGRTAQDWTGNSLDSEAGLESVYSASPGPALVWSLGFDFRDPEVPWSARLGFGQEQQRGVPEPRSGLFALGLGYDFEGVRVDVSGLRHSVQRVGRANSFDDRIVGSATVGF